MSDGPHRSLNMSPAWRSLAERGSNCAFDPAEIRLLAERVLAQDFRNGVEPGLIKALHRLFVGERDLFQTPEETIDRLRPQFSTSPLSALLLDCALAELKIGKPGSAGLVESTANALCARGIRGSRQVEEHYLRKSTTRASIRVRSRIDQAMRSVAVENLARQLLGMQAASRQKSIKQRGLDQGVKL